MASSFVGTSTDDWVSSGATNVACKQLLFGQENLSSEGYLRPEYEVTF